MSDDYTAESAAAIDRSALQRNLDVLERLGEAVGEWTDKTENRQTGVSMHLRFTNKVDVMTSMEFAEVMQRSPAMLADAIRRLLAITSPKVSA